jgi:RNA polymerase sigma factor (sigma-70 family)
MPDDQAVTDEGPARSEYLFAAFRTGHAAFVELLMSHREYLLKIINDEMPEKLRSHAGASDIVQDAIVNVVNMTTNRLFAVRTEDDLKSWLRRVGLNALKKEWRDQRRDRRDLLKAQPLPDGLDLKSSGLSPSSEYRRRERDDSIAQVIRDMPEADRLLFRLRYENRWSYMALAELLEGQASDAGRKRVQRRLDALVEEVAENPRIKDSGI